MKLTPGQATLDVLERLYEGRQSFSLDPACRPSLEASAARVQAVVDGDEAVYGINTGFGKLASIRIRKADTVTLQRNLILSHSAGTGQPLPIPVVRLMMALKLLSLGRGASGVRWCVIEQIERFIAADIVPVVPGQGSVGASGDLAPLAHMTAALLGEGKVYHRSTMAYAKDALASAGIDPLVLSAKEGLALINGTQASTALALAGLFQAWRLVLVSLTSSALSVDAAMGTSAPFREEIHTLRGHPGQIEAARRLRELLDGSNILTSHKDGDDRVQDP